MEAEQQLLGKLLCGNASTLLPNIQNLQEHHFQHPLHAQIFSAIKEKALSGAEPTPVLIKMMLPESLFDEVGGNKYLADIAGLGSMVFGLKDVGDAIIEQHHRRTIIKILEKNLTAEITNSNEVIDRVVEELSELREGSKGWALKDFQEMSFEIIKDMEKTPLVYPTGLKCLDASMEGGLQAGKSYYVAGQSGVGKTALLGTVSANLNQSGVKHLFIAAEMGAKRIHQRQMARKMQEMPSRFQTHRNHEGFIKSAFNAAHAEQKNGIYLDAPGISFDRLKQVLGYAVSKHKITGVVLDYIQLVTGKPSKESDAAFIGQVAQWMAAFCGEHDIWNLSVAQLNRDGEILGSGGIKRAADQMYIAHKNSAGGIWFECDKSRDSPEVDVGSEAYPAFRLNKLGAYFEEA